MSIYQINKPLSKALAFFMCLSFLLSFLPAYVAIAEDDTDSNNKTNSLDIIRTVELQYQNKGESTWVDFTSPYSISDITKINGFRAKYSFALNDRVDDEGGCNREITGGDYYLITLPEEIQLDKPADGIIKDEYDGTLARYSFSQSLSGSWQIKVEFDDYINDDNLFDIHGEFEFEFKIDASQIADGTTQTIYIPIDNDTSIGIKVTKPEPPPTRPISLTKTANSYNHLTRELRWNVKIDPATGIFSGCTFTDIIDAENLELVSVKHGSITLSQINEEDGTGDYTYDEDTGLLVYTIPEGRDRANYQNIEIITRVKRDVYAKAPASTTIRNNAALTGGENDVNLTSNTATYTVTPDWLKKSGNAFAGNKIRWTITANTTRQDIYNAVITDRFQSDVVLDKNSVKLGNTSIPIYDAAENHQPESDNEIYGVIKENADGTSELKIYLPRGRQNASNQTQTITLETSIIPPSKDQQNPQVPRYNNEVELEADYRYDGDGTGDRHIGNITANVGQNGVAVPHLSITKGHQTISTDDKRNGTITWIITAASNLSDYGKSKIIDTLPADQDYLEVFWVNGNKVLDETTEPSAVISSDGRTLTITFNEYNALQTQQTFRVKTQIKNYGQNINRKTYTNAVSGQLLDKVSEEVIHSSNANDSVSITNTVISKLSSEYKGTANNPDANPDNNPRVNFSITINDNLMHLKNVVVTDALDNIVTTYTNSKGESVTINSPKWTYVPGTLTIQRVSGTRDLETLGADAIKAIIEAAELLYAADIESNTLVINFGNDFTINDKYTISFTAELDISENDAFKENGVIKVKDNKGSISGEGLTGTITSPGTDQREIENTILSKAGKHNGADEQVEWTINLNQRKIMLSNTRVQDTLPFGLTLDPASIKLYENVIKPDGCFLAGDEIELLGKEVDFDYTYELSTDPEMQGRYVLTVDLPENETPYILRFATYIDWTRLGSNTVNIQNDAFFAGESAEYDNSSTSSLTLNRSASSGSTRKASLTVNKRSKDTGALVDGAKFALHWLRVIDNSDPENPVYAEPVYIRTLTAENGSVIFKGLTRGETYTITEVSPPEGYLLDDPEPVIVYIPESGNAETVEFRNTPVKYGSWLPSAIKELDGKALSSISNFRTFEFEIIDEDNESRPVVLTGKTTTERPDGSFLIEFNKAANLNDLIDVLEFEDDTIFEPEDENGTEQLISTRTFTMREVPPQESKLEDWSGYTFDSTVYTLIVKVYNVKGRQDLKVVIENENRDVLSNDSGSFTEEGIPVFRNVYEAEGSIRINAEKIVEGHTLSAEQFEFELYELLDGEVVGEVPLKTIKNSIDTSSEGPQYTGTFEFALEYTQDDVGVKTYRIIEKNHGMGGYGYDPAEYTVTVSVSDNDDGTLTSTIEKIEKTLNGSTNEVEEIIFTNTYTTSDVKVELAGRKTLSGRVIEDGQFSFVLNQVTEDGTLVKKIEEASNAGNDITFSALTFEQEDIGQTYYYQILEVDSKQPGYTYDSTVYDLSISIKDNDDGTLTAEQTLTKAGEAVTQIEFENNYQAAGETTVTASKTLSGKAIKEGQFGFELLLIDSELSDTVLTGNDESAVVSLTARNDAEGKVVFPSLTFDQDDAGKSFIYLVREINEQIGGYTYDDRSYTILVTVEDNGDGTLNVQQEIIEPADSEEIVFGNTYTILQGSSVQLTAQKTLNRRALENGQFTFVLSQINPETGESEEIQRITNSADGSILFDELVYAQEDMDQTFYYTIEEINDSKPGYQYDDTIYTVAVRVIDNNDGTLSTEVLITKAGSQDEIIIVEDMVFTNIYTAEGSIGFTAIKKLIGSDLKDGMFEFALTDEAGTVLQTASNDSEGKVVFQELSYNQDQQGEYKYTIAEVKGNLSSIIYDDTTYQITVIVEDAGDGTLETSAVITSDNKDVDPDDMVFTNKYQEPEKPNVPATGDYPNVIWYGILALIALAALIMIREKNGKQTKIKIE